MGRIELRTAAFRAAVALALSMAPLALGACGGGDDEDDAADSGMTGGRNDAGPVGRDDGGEDVDQDGGTPREDGAVISDARVDDDTGTPVDSLPPTLSEGTFRQIGRDGRDVRIDVSGIAGDSPVSTISVRLVNASGDDVPLQDTDGDGELNGGVIPFALDTPISNTKTGGDAFVTFAGVYARDTSVDHAIVRLIDAEQQESEELTLAFEEQTVLDESAACDRTYIENRCGDDLSCKGTGSSATCKPGEAPVIEKLGYFVDALGSRMLIAVNDPDDDIASYAIEYRNAQGQAVNIDTDGDQIADSSRLEIEVQPGESSGSGGKFFVRLDVSQDIVDTVASISVTVTDRGDRTSAPRTADKGPAPAKANNASCDTRTFDRCNAGSVCVPGNTAPVGTCRTLAQARTTACNAALELNPADGVTHVQGTIAYPSLWDVPTGGCSANDPTARPERLVKLTLADHADTVILSTNYALTNFDTTLYAMTSCTGTPSIDWCVDDLTPGEPNYQRAILTLTDLDPGDYFIVVDSYPSMGLGSAFELSVEIQ